MKSGHDRIIAILMERDELTEEEAREQVEEAVELINEILESGGSYEEAEEILLDDLGLEMDYIFDLLL
jgi:nucleoid DNA-binding protein